MGKEGGVHVSLAVQGRDVCNHAGVHVRLAAVQGDDDVGDHAGDDVGNHAVEKIRLALSHLVAEKGIELA